MSYKNKTNFYRIPFMGRGDAMTEKNNTQQWSIVDSLLYVATFGCDTCFLQEGNYEIEKHVGYYRLKISPFGYNGFSIMGMLNYRLFYSKQVLTSENLYFNKRYYIYIESADGFELNPNAFLIRAYTTKQIPVSSQILLCIVETTQEPKIITDLNKVYAKNILAHTKDNTNPHGKQIYQYDLNIINSLKLKNEELHACIYSSYVTQKNEYRIDFPENKQVIYVTAYPESIEAGNIAWKIENKQIVLFNSGAEGIKVNLKFDVR